MKTDAAKKLILGATKGIETTLGELYEALEITDDHLLDRAVRVSEFLATWDFKLSPNIRVATSDAARIRLLRASDSTVESDVKIDKEINAVESHYLEFKSSLFFDRKKFEYNSNLSEKEYKSPGVTHSSLKTIAGFLNSDGGVLYIGVFDDGGIAGLADDFPYTKQKDIDSWQLSFQDQIKKRFKDGDAIIEYCRIQIVWRDELPIARIEVTPRRQLSFLISGKGNQYCFYVRHGNETNEIGIENIQEFFHRTVS